MPDVCERCGFPAVEIAGKWMHLQYADAVFCAIVMAALDNEDVSND